ncbi:sialin-like [Octopus bimaculoides]|nr:sialin-like [Octopus bimaculoides]
MSKFTSSIAHYCSCRWRLCYMCFTALLLLQALRIDLSMAFVCMLKTPNRTTDDVSFNQKNEQCHHFENHTLNNNFEGEFEWSNVLQSNMLSGYYYGYIASTMFGGVFADKYGGKKVLGGTLLSSAIFAILHPSLTRISGYFTVVLRILTGLVSGPMFPSVLSLLGRWAPPLESSILLGVTFCGQMLGSILGLLISGYLCAYGFDNGWGSIFYIFGGATLLFSLVWFYVVYDNPDTHPTISERERSYLKQNITSTKKVKSIPWKQIMLSSAVWALIIAHTCLNWTDISFQLLLPLYMKEALNIDTKSNGLMSSAPSIGELICIPLYGRFADWFISKNYMSKRSVRVLIQSLCFISLASLLIAIGFLECSQTALAGALFLLSGASISLYMSGFNVNHIDVAPRYAGVLFGISNTFASLPGLFAPLVARAIAPNGTQREWQHVLFMCAAFSVLGAILYAILAKGDVQAWAISKEGSEDGCQEEPMNLENK